FEEQTIDEKTILIGHSCGSAFLVRWLGETKRKIKKLILVAPWKIPKAEDENREKFYTYTIDSTIKERITDITIFTSNDEEDEGKKSVQLFHEALGGKIIELNNHGHYTLSDMKTEAFPELFQEIIPQTRTPLPKKNPHEQLKALQEELQPLRQQLETLHQKKETAFKNKEQLKKDLQENVKKLKELQKKHQEQGKGLQEAKKHKNEERTTLQTLREELTKLREQKKAQETALPKGNYSLLKKKIEQLELSIETEGYDYKKEQKVMKEIKKLKQDYSQVKNILDINQKIKKVMDHIREHGQQFEVYATVMKAAGSKDYEEFKTTLDNVKKLRIAEEKAFNEFIQNKETFNPLYKRFKIIQQEITTLRQQLGTQQRERKTHHVREHKSKEQTFLQEKVATVEEKWKKGKKLTTADLIALQGKK
ncbi:MAG: alpha/beta hydrolase, partial [Nanoarchaeota archaeon]|nr:alpha/beta hydrolase [Nanoarchaeota archaeon]